MEPLAAVERQLTYLVTITDRLCCFELHGQFGETELVLTCLDSGLAAQRFDMDGLNEHLTWSGLLSTITYREGRCILFSDLNACIVYLVWELEP